MDRNHYLRTNFLPLSSASLGYVPAQTTHHQSSYPSQSHQNVMFGNGMMTVRVPRQQYPTPQPTITISQQDLAMLFLSDEPKSHSVSASSSYHTPIPQWESGGAIIVDNDYHIKSGGKCQAIFLGLNHRTGKYELFYGKRDPADTSSNETSLRECTEETSNMFRFTNYMFDNSFSVKSPNQKHHAYVVRVQAPKHGIQSKIFFQNLSLLKSRHTPYQWRELSGMTRINIEEAINSGILNHPNGDFSMFDVYGNPITIFSRDAEFIRDALKRKLNLTSPVHQLKFVASYDSKYHGGKDSFLNGTSYYTV
jgi:hypothetical protein